MEHKRRADGQKIPAAALQKQKQIRAMRWAFVVLVVAVILGSYSVISAAVNRFHWKLDLTQGQVFQMTDTTKDILDELEQDVTITYCNNQNSADSNIVEVLNRYAAASAHIAVEYVDLAANPALVAQYAQRNISLSTDSVLVRCGTNAQLIEWNSLYEITTYADASGKSQYTLTGLRAETQITSALVNVLSQELIGVAFTAGHSEDAPEALKALIRNSNYEVQQLVLGVDAMAANVKTLVIAGATRDFSDRELQLLDEFMVKGGNLVVFRNPEVESLPKLDAYLREWGLSVENQMVLEPRQQMDSPLHIIPSFGVSMMNVYFSEHSTYLVLPKCRSLTMENTNHCITNEVLKSTSAAYGKDFREMTSLTQAEGDTAGPFTVAATSERSYTDSNGEAQTQYVFLTACTDVYQENYLKTRSLGNADLVLQVLSYFNGHEVSLNIPTKNLAANAISISRTGTVLFALVFLGLLPLGFLAAGVTRFLKRRHS